MPLRLVLALMALAASAALGVSGSGHAAATLPKLSVTPGGSDSSACAIAAPCGSLGRAYAVAKPGQTVLVATGSYRGQQLRPDGSKTSAQDVVIRAAPGASPSLSGLDIYASHVTVQGLRTGGWYVKPGATDVTLKNVVSTSPVFVTAASNVRILGGEVYSRGYVKNGSQLKDDNGVPPRNIVFDGVSFHDFRKSPSSSDHVDCLHIMAGDGITIRNSRFRNCEHFDILFTMFGSSGSPKNVLVENNFFSCCGSGYYSLQLGGGHGERWENFLIRYNSTDKAMTVDDDSTVVGNIRFDANIVPSFSSGLCHKRGVVLDYNVIGEGSRCGPHDRIAPNGFVDAAAFNFHLKPGAAAIGHGDPTSFPRVDVDHQGRPNGKMPDAGADERRR